jgi:hypothetical protein
VRAASFFLRNKGIATAIAWSRTPAPSAAERSRVTVPVRLVLTASSGERFARNIGKVKESGTEVRELVGYKIP